MASVPLPAPTSGPSRRGFHRLATFAACPQRFAYREVLRLETRRASEALSLGTLLHLALMWHYLRLRAERRREPMDGLLDPVAAMRAAPARVAWCFDRAAEVYDAYRRWSSTADASMEVIDVEREYAVRVQGRLYTQRADLTVAVRGKAFFWDHKCSLAGAVDTVPAWRLLDGQVHGYEVIGEALSGGPPLHGLPFGGVVLNMIGCAPPYRFRAHPLVLDDGLRDSFLATAAATDAAIGTADSMDPWSYEKRGLVSGACQDRYGACDYVPLCRFGKAGLGDYLAAADEATFARQGSGR